MWRVIVAIGLVISATVVVTPTAVFACSCAAVSAREHLEQADAAFVGTLVSREDENSATSSADEIAWLFEVEQAVKGDIGSQVEVQSAVSGASCGFEIAVGQRVGVTLYKQGDQWHGSLCGQVNPETLLAATQPAPAPDGSGPVTLLVGNRGEDPRTIALDSEGRTLAYGDGDGEVRSIAVCPTSERFIELVAYPDTPIRKIAVRDTRSLRIVSEYALPNAEMSVVTLHCRNEAGSDIFVHEVPHTSDGLVSNQVHRLQDGQLQAIYATEVESEGGHQAAFDFDNGVVYLTTGYRGNNIVRVDLETGEAVPLASAPPIEGETDYLISLKLSPDGTRLAVIGYQPGVTANYRLLVIDVETEPAEIAVLSLADFISPHSVLWLDNETFMVASDNETPTGSPVFNTELEQVGSISGWTAREPVLIDDTLYGLDWYGFLHSAALPDGPTTTLRTFDNPNIYVMAGVPDEIEIEPVMTQVPDATEAVAPTRTIPPATPTVEIGTSMVGDYSFGDSDVDSESSTAPDSRGWLLILGLLIVAVAGGGWGVYWLRGN